MARNGQYKGHSNPDAPRHGKGGGTNGGDRTTCSECQQVQGRHTSTCSRRS